jgi:hypothetical protein
VADVGAFDEAVVGEGDDHRFVGDEVLDGDLAFVGDDLGESRGGVLGADGLQFVFDDAEHAFLAGEDVEQVLDASISSSYSPLTLSRSRPVSW